MTDPRTSSRGLGGVIHTYLAYDPKRFPSPTAERPDMVGPAFEHMLMFGSTRRLTPEELANAVRIDPSQIKGLGPSIDALLAMLLERKRKILATYETDSVQETARRTYVDQAAGVKPPKALQARFTQAVRNEQVRDLESLWYRIGDERSAAALHLLHLIERLGEKYEIDALAAKYEFTGPQGLTVPEAIAVKEELEMIDRLLEQLTQARQTAQIGIIDMEALAHFAEPGDIQGLRALQQQVEDYLQEVARQQGLEFTREGYQLSPLAYRLFQSRLLQHIFSDLQAARSGRHAGPVIGEGAVELPQTKSYEFGDSMANMDIAQSLINAMLRQTSGGQEGRPALPVRMRPDDIEIHRTRNTPKCATVVILDMSGSMRYEGQYINVKRMGLALDGLIRTEYPGDFLSFVEMYTFARLRHVSELPSLMPRPVTIHQPMVRLRADMSDPDITELDVPQHFTNIQRALQIARRLLSAQDTPNRQIVLITDGLPTAHFEGEQLVMLYPPEPRTERHTMQEAQRCASEGMVINVFLLPNWSQTHEDVQFAQRMVQATAGRVFFTGGKDLDRYVVWDYIARRRTIIG